MAAQLVDMVSQLLLGDHCMRMAYVKRGLSCIFRPVAFITLQFGRCSFQFFFCYMPTSWDPYHEAEEIYDFRLAASAMVAGDFNAKLADP